MERVAPALKSRQKKKKRKKKQKKKWIKEPSVICGINVVDEVRRIEALEIVSAAYTNLERKPVIVQVRCRKKGDHATGWADYVDCKVTLTYPNVCTYGKFAVLIAHEIAHIATANGENHGAAWRDMFLAILRDGYNFDVGWPINEAEKRVGYNFAHDIFESMLDEQHAKRST